MSDEEAEKVIVVDLQIDCSIDGQMSVGIDSRYHHIGRDI